MCQNLVFVSRIKLWKKIWSYTDSMFGLTETIDPLTAKDAIDMISSQKLCGKSFSSSSF